MKSALKIFLLFLLPILAHAQNENSYPDSLLVAFSNAANDTIRLDISRNLGFYYQDSEPRLGLPHHERQLVLAKKLKLKLWEADAYQQIAYCHLQLDNLPLAYENYMQGLRVVEDSIGALNGYGYANFSFSKSPREALKSIEGMIHYELSTFYNRTRLYEQTRYHIFKALQIGETLGNQKILSLVYRDIGYFIYYLNDKPDSAFLYLKKALHVYTKSPYQRNRSVVDEFIGYYYGQKGVYDSAKFYFNVAINESQEGYASSQRTRALQGLGQVYAAMGQLDSALVYTLQAQNISESINNLFDQAQGFANLASIYKSKNQYDIAYDYSVKAKNLSDSLNEAYITRLMQFQNLSFDQKIRLSELEKESQEAKAKNRMYALMAGLFTFLIIALLLLRNNRQKKKANQELEETLNNLKSTQSQLIQSEKMASLGELTAGIAHEIQNPLNFVNNFAEVNKELIEEVEEELSNGNVSEVKSLFKDIKENEDKISHHGKRADAIVKGMLEHSRTSTTEKEPTKINELADEFFRLAYHGLRAKDKSFNATLVSNYDDAIGKVNINRQDIGRVVLNLINNAFYAVHEKKKSGEMDYEPTVSVITKKISLAGEEQIQISVKDNGNGIPQKVLDKIFQPFFTTKPTGQGTGLGLSLSYDIVKTHGGEIKIETKENEGTEFIIYVPA